MDLQLIAAIVFFILLGLFLLIERKKIVMQKILFPIIYIFMFRTKLGLVSMDALARKYPRSMRFFAISGIVIGYVGMVYICGYLGYSLYKLLTDTTAVAAVAPVLPFKAKGIFYVPFFYWIISIFIIAVIHEFSHGMVARLYKIPLHSSGFAFLSILIPILPAAFVEPDEKVMVKRPFHQQAAVFAAGAFSNVVTAGLMILLALFVFSPLAGKIMQNDGILVVGLTNETSTDIPSQHAGMQPNELILSINNVPMQTVNNFTTLLDSVKPGDVLQIKTNVTNYAVTLASNPKNSSKAYLGTYVTQNTQRRPEFEQRYGKITADVIQWLAGLVFILYALSLGIGIINLVPIGPVDGGRMFKVLLQKYLPDERALVVWKYVSLVLLAAILANMYFAFAR